MNVLSVTDTATTPPPTTSRGRIVPFIVGAAAVLLLVPVALYFWFIHQYGVNVIRYDQWNDVALLTHTPFFHYRNAPTYSHTTIAAMWAQHGEDRTFFPDLVVLALGRLTSLNVLTELYLSAVLLVIACVLIIFAHRQDVTRTRLVFYLPVAFLVFTLGQYENTLFGFQLWLYLVMATLAATIFLLDLQRSSWLILIAAIATAVIGSYSAIDGLVIWPAGLVVLLWKRRPRAFVLTWLIATMATTGLYLYHFQYSAATAGGGTSSYVLAHPLSAAKFFFFAVGDVMGRPLPQTAGTTDPSIVGIGGAVFLLAVVSLAIYGRRRRLSRSPVGPALICFGLLLAVFVTIGRAHLGLWAASQSRFVTEDVLILVGCYLCLLERWPAHDQESVAASFAAIIDALRKADPPARILRSEWRQGLLVALRTVVILLIFVEIQGGIENGIPSGATTRQTYQFDDLVAAHAAEAPDSLIKSALYPAGDFAFANIRALAEAAKKDHLSFFATSEASRLERMSLPKISVPPPSTGVAKPANDTILRGATFLVAMASSDYPITSVDFQIGDSAGQQVELVRARHFKYGWLGAWLTTRFPNGAYTVQSTVKNSDGQSSTSKAVSVTVEN